LGAFKRIRFGDGRKVIQEGLEKVTSSSDQIGIGLIIVIVQFGKAFKVAEVNGWVVVVSGRDKVEELRSAPDETLSFMESIGEASLSPVRCLPMQGC
jgi:hypothetical protein